MKIKSVLLVLLFLLPAVAFAQQKELKVLFVGNSYTYGYNLAHIVSIMSEECSTKLITRKSVIGGARLSQHWLGQRELETKKIIAEGDFDLVVLQDFSMSGINTPDSTLKYVKLFSDYNSQHGAKTCLFNTWARQRVPQFQEEIDDMYIQAALEKLPTLYRIEDARGETVRLMNHNPEDAEFCRRIALEICEN